MKQGVVRTKLPAESAARNRPASPWRLFWLVLAGALLTGFVIYAPAFNGEFVFDDFGLPFELSSGTNPLKEWVSGVRPVLMFSYWLNDRLWGEGPVSFHVLNFLIHTAATSFVFLILHRLFEIAGWAARTRGIGAIVGAAIFLIHPLETESVSYVAGRSESLAALFVLLAYTVFLYRAREAISWKEATAVVVLFGLAVGTKENAVSLAGILVLTDLYWPAPFSILGLRANWRLYALIAPGAAVSALVVLRKLAMTHDPTAGFSLRSFTWYQYLFTEARAIFVYIRMALFPVGQSIDHDFAPSGTILEHGAIFYMAALAALLAVAIRVRRRYPLSCFGLLFFLVVLAPTSSVVPIADALVERRMYLALTGLLLIGCELAPRIRPSRPSAWVGLAAALILLANLCYERNRLWGHPDELMAAATLQAVHNSRPLANLTDLLIARNRCDAAGPYLESASRRFPSDYWGELSWGRILECLGRRDEAMARLRRAAAIAPTSKIFELIGLLYGEMSHPEEAGAALQTAVKIDPASITAHKALAMWYEWVGNLGQAEREYVNVLNLDYNDSKVHLALERVRQSLAGQ